MGNEIVVSLSLLVLSIFPLSIHAACPTTSPYSAVVQNGGTCTYSGASFQDGLRKSAVVDIKGDGTAIFTAPTVQLWKTNWIGGGKPEEYSAIYLQDSLQGNAAVFEGNVIILENPALNTRDIVIGGNGNLHIKGNLTITHDHKAGALFDLGSYWNPKKEKDGSMQIDGKFTGVTEGSDFIRVGEGTYSFNGDVKLTATKGGRIRSNGGATVNFNGDTVIKNTDVFLDIRKNTSPTFNFNKLRIENNSLTGTDALFRVLGGTTNFRADTTISVPNAYAIKLGNATLTNNGILSVTSKDDIAILAIPEESQTARFFNKTNGVLSTSQTAIVNDGVGELVIDNEGTLSSTEGVIFANRGEGKITATNKGTLKGYLDSNSITLDNQSTGLWQVTKNSMLNTLTNTGTIQFPASNNSPTVLSVDTYTGGGRLLVNSSWNKGDAGSLNGSSQSDLLRINKINGDAVTTVAINAASLGNIVPKEQDISSANVVEVNSNHSGNLFVGTVATDSGTEAQLKREGNNYRWTLSAQTPVGEEPIISKPVVGYVQMPYVNINQQMGLSQLGQLHQRVGEQNEIVVDQHDTSLWGRVYIDSQKLQGKHRFGSKVHSGFIQFGKDFLVSVGTDNARSHMGMMLTYGWAESSFYDKYRAENGNVITNKLTGKAHTDMFSIGGYHTYYSPKRFYIDTVAQLSWLQNHYQSEQSLKQKGHGVAVSVELGKSFKLWNTGFAIEPQAQLTYQWLNLQNFHDGFRSVKVPHLHNLTARIGSRLTYNTGTASMTKFNISANLIKTLMGSSSEIKVGNRVFKETFSDLALELGLGADFSLTQSLNVYTDFRYKRSLGDRNRIFSSNSLGQSSYSMNVGLRYAW